MKSYAVIGMGRFGSELAEKLFARGNDVLGIDTKEELVERMADRVTRAAVADGKDKEALRALGVHNCDCAIVAQGTDLASSVLITMNLKSLQVPYVICKAQDETHREILEKLGADRVIIPERVVADRLARSLTSSDVLDFIEVSADYGIIEMRALPAWSGKTIRELNVRAKYGVSIIAVKEKEEIKVAPAADYSLNEQCILVLLGDYEALSRIENLKK